MAKLGQKKHPQSDDSHADYEPHYDVIIIGGGINGCGIARELAAKGYSVYLAEARDLSSGTSSWSTKLIHGGLRYLEHYEFRLVREALRERETLMKMAPHLIHPLRFILPHLPSMRPKWLLRLGLFLYDNLGGRQKLAGSHSINLKQDEDKSKQDNFYSTWAKADPGCLLTSIPCIEISSSVTTVSDHHDK